MRRFGYCADAHSKRFSNDVAPDDPKPWRRVEEAHADDVHAHVQAEASGGPSASLSGGLWLNGDASMTRPVVSATGSIESFVEGVHVNVVAGSHGSASTYRRR